MTADADENSKLVLADGNGAAKVLMGTADGDFRLDMDAGAGAQNVIRVFRPGENIFNLATDGAENSILFLSDGTGAATIKLSTAGDTYLTGGNLGIGTQTPATALDVNGTVTATTLNVAGTATATAFVGDGSGLTNLPGGSGDITAVNAGTGMSGGGITGDVTLNVDTTVIQNRVASTCAAGSSIRAIAQDGTVTCETDDGGAGGGGTVTSVDSGTGLTGGPVTTSGTLSIDTAVVPQLATANSFTGAQSSLTGTGTAAVSGTHTAMTGKGVVGYMSSTTGVNFGGDFQTDSATLNAAAVRGIASSADLAAGVTYGGFFQSNSPAGVALLGEATANSGDAWGIIGSCSGTIGAYVGVTGQAAFSSGILLPQRTGVWGDSISGYRVFATSFNNRALVARNDNSQTTLEIQNLDPNGALIVAFDDLGTQRFSVDSGGNTLIQGGLTVIGDSTVTGAKSASVELDTGEKVNVYAIESPESWFEDFGSGQLNSGRTTIRIDPMFAQTVNTNEDYYVFITPTAECNGLYVSQKSPGTFSVREMGGGESSASFDYRIVAHRNGYEDLRFGPTFMPEASQPAQASARVEPGSPRRGRR